MTAPESASTPTAASLLTAGAVRHRCRLIYETGLKGDLEHFLVQPEKLGACARFVADIIRDTYPSLQVPPHSRWRHLGANGRDWATRLAPYLSTEPLERARQRVELAITSVLLDAGAGPDWRWRDPVTGRNFSRSEGLALASLEAFREGLFSSFREVPCRADAAGLADLSAAGLAATFQVSDTNALLGIEGRIELLRRLGNQLTRHPEVFGQPARLGNLVDHLGTQAPDKRIALPHVLSVVLATLGGMWSGRFVLDGVDLGDTWRHPAAVVPGSTNGFVPFHKLSQWLTYSLVEPLEEAGLRVEDLDGLTGLAEYRNGGLFVDMGVLMPRDHALFTAHLAPGQTSVVEWRALTVALLDEIAPLVRAEIGVDPDAMPLCAVLEGGTWAAGRRVARSLRPDGAPPFKIESDGTVF